MCTWSIGRCVCSLSPYLVQPQIIREVEENEKLFRHFALKGGEVLPAIIFLEILYFGVCVFGQ